MVFMILKRLFELTVIFFRLTNSPTIFQTIINKILARLNQYWRSSKFY